MAQHEQNRREHDQRGDAEGQVHRPLEPQRETAEARARESEQRHALHLVEVEPRPDDVRPARDQVYVHAELRQLADEFHAPLRLAHCGREHDPVDVELPYQRPCVGVTRQQRHQVEEARGGVSEGARCAEGRCRRRR